MSARRLLIWAVASALPCFAQAQTAGIIRAVAGTGVAGFSGDGGPAVSAALNTPIVVAVDGSGRFYIADSGNHRVRKVDPNGIISTFAGTGSPGFSGDRDGHARRQLHFARRLAQSD